MKLNSHHFSLFVVGILLLTVGFTISKNRAPSSKSDTSSPPFENLQNNRRQPATATDLHHRLTMIDEQAGPERLLRLIATIERSSLDTLPELARHYLRDGPILGILTLHWFNLDPNHCLQTILLNRSDQSFPAETLMHRLMDNWLKQNFAGLVQAIDGLPLQDRKWWGFTDTYCDIADLDYQTGLRLMREAELTNTSPSSQQIVQLAAGNPKKIADDLLQVTNGYALMHGLEQVATEWAKSEPGEALTYALAIPGARGNHMSSAAITTWAGLAPEAAANWLNSQPNTRIQDTLRPALLKAWQKTDPGAAHDYCLRNLSGFRQRQALRLLVKEPASD